MSTIAASATVDTNEDGQLVLALTVDVDGIRGIDRELVVSRPNSKTIAERILRSQGPPLIIAPTDRTQREAAAWKALAKALMLTAWDTPPGQDAPRRWREEAQEKAKDALRAMGIDPDAPEEM